MTIKPTGLTAGSTYSLLSSIHDMQKWHHGGMFSVEDAKQAIVDALGENLHVPSYAEIMAKKGREYDTSVTDIEDRLKTAGVVYFMSLGLMITKDLYAHKDIKQSDLQEYLDIASDRAYIQVEYGLKNTLNDEPEADMQDEAYFGVLPIAYSVHRHISESSYHKHIGAITGEYNTESLILLADTIMEWFLGLHICYVSHTYY